jgi:hypothetical protein
VAIRQSDEQFLMKTVVPALQQAESYFRTQDLLLAMRDGEDEVTSSITADVTRALDDLCLRVKHHGSWGWATIRERMEEIQERCEHAARRPWTITVKETGERFRVVRCDRCKLDLSRDPIEEEQAETG